MPRPRFEKGSSRIHVQSATAEPAWSRNIPYYMPLVVSRLCKIQSKPVTVSKQITVPWRRVVWLFRWWGWRDLVSSYKTTRRNNTGNSKFNETKHSHEATETAAKV